MEYNELIERVLKGRSVNATAKAIGIPQQTLDKYVKAERMPDFDTGMTLIQEAGVSKDEGFETLAVATRRHKVVTLKKQQGFVQTGLLFTLGQGTIVAILSILCQIRYP
jgi:hypothetical protein